MDDTRRAELYSRIEYHTCLSGHGVIRGVSTADMQDTLAMLKYYYGRCCAWRKGRDLEFVNMTKVYPPPKKPWEWCGQTILFDKERIAEMVARECSHMFERGDRVLFEYPRGTQREGIVSAINKRVSVVVAGEKGVFYIPGTQLIKAD